VPPDPVVANVVVWKHKQEFWIDEIKNYRVKVESQCTP